MYVLPAPQSSHKPEIVSFPVYIKMKNLLNVWKSTTTLQNQWKRKKTVNIFNWQDNNSNQRTLKTKISKETYIKPFCKSESIDKVSQYFNAQLIHVPVHCIKTVWKPFFNIKRSAVTFFNLPRFRNRHRR